MGSRRACLAEWALPRDSPSLAPADAHPVSLGPSRSLAEEDFVERFSQRGKLRKRPAIWRLRRHHCVQNIGSRAHMSTRRDNIGRSVNAALQSVNAIHKLLI